MILIKIETLLEGRKVEQNRIEYKEDVPVEIRVYVDQIQIINFPGPDHYIDMEKFATGKVRARRYRNPKIGEFEIENFGQKNDRSFN